MSMSGGDPTVLESESSTLPTAADDIGTHAGALAAKGKGLGGACGDGEIAEAAERATAVVAGVLTAMSGLATSLGSGASTAAAQLRRATEK